MSYEDAFSVVVHFKGIDLLCEGSWERGHNGYVSTFNDPLGEPPEPSEIEIEEISIKLDFDIIPIDEIIHPQYKSELELLCLEQLHEY
ncbi:hypothetical protein KY321_02685 [Candidatus Woesearchaeota archaeon]|nr:hypothetical protein [Candidatus Woesearchaeota archaeon]